MVSERRPASSRGPTAICRRRALGGQSEGRFERELVESVESRAVCGEQRELEEGGARQDGRAEDGVVGEPRVVGEREAAGVEDAVGIGQRRRGPQQGVVGGALTGGRDVGVSLGRVEPVALRSKA